MNQVDDATQDDDFTLDLDDDADESSLAGDRSPASGQNDVADDDDLAELLHDIPEEHRQVAIKAAKKAQRRVEGKWGEWKRDAERREAYLQQRLEQSLQNAPRDQKPAQREPADAEEAEIRKRLETLYPGLKNLDNYESSQATIRQQQAELQMAQQLDNVEKQYGKHFAPFRSLVENAVRANGYQVNQAVSSLLSDVKQQIEEKVALDKKRARNRANVGQEPRNVGGGSSPESAVMTKGGSFDWHGTYNNIRRRNGR